MKKESILLIIVTCLILSACGNRTNNNKKENQMSKGSIMQIEGKKSGILEKINKIPVTPLPIGIEHLNSVIELDYNDFGIKNVPINYDVDIYNKLGLNDSLYSDLDLSSYDSNLKKLRASIIPVDSVKIYLSKRLPPKDNYNFLLCKVIQYVGLGDPFTGWILFVIKDQSVIQYIQVAQSQTAEEVCNYTLFSMNKDYTINTSIYVMSYDTPPYNIAYLSGKQTYVFSLEDGMFNLEKERYIENDKLVDFNDNDVEN